MNYARDLDIKNLVKLTLKEDIQTRDITTEALVSKNNRVKAVLLAKENCIICGLGIAAVAFRQLDKDIKFKAHFKDGGRVKKGAIIATVFGRTRGILTAERVALNFLSLLSGISTKTRKFVEAVKPYKAKIIDTRKTIPLLRTLQKYAIRCGGGFNHRMSLDEMVLVKDNHRKTIGNRLWVLGFKKIREKFSGIKIELEVNTLLEFKKALVLKPEIIMLDNMAMRDIEKAVKIRNSLSPNTKHLTPKLEASGGVTLKNIKQVAATGVEMISIGNLTHSLDSIDISLEIQ